MTWLSGLRVLEVGSDLAVHYAGRELAGYGAEVLKVEPPAGDPSRRRGPYVRDVPHQEGSSLFLYLNTGKRGITLDVTKPTGAEILTRLAAGSDIVLWGGTPAAGKAAFDDLPSRQDPELSTAPGPVWLNVSPFGAAGPHADWLARGINLFHAGGEGYLMPGGLTYLAYMDREPIKGPRHLGEFGEGVIVAIGALIGLLLQRQSAAPLFIDVSGQEALLQLLRVDFSLHVDEGQHVSRAMRSLGAGGLLPAKDGYVEVLPLEERMWQALIEFMGNPDWSKTPEFQGQQTRRGAGNAIVERLADWTVTKTREELYHEGQRRQIAVGSVMTPSEVMASPQMAYRKFFTPIDHPYAGTLLYPRLPLLAEPALEPVTQPAPLLGQHNVEVYEALGYVRREVVALYEAGII